jgi:uncharacterized protein YceH (UPF0502 family)
MTNWTQDPPMVVLLKKLNELMTRMKRLETLQQMERTHTVLQALTNKEKR